ncbi:DNA photolyase family protein [Sandaracinobacter sp. RS1-74]|uniref:cryptochrome/photolyase family protein n=1 Tax=Sandaracinobacteroides sayramensis TaxID=2913411 RepID=UPI001EDAE5DB|nr:deoxyribodipyrimidine photo-lyase [Sandaracinobacteroides sayramensis]MCG2840229.1 DNA photolyase family protein [Sandaracinobacteroides sayramensis]
MAAPQIIWFRQDFRLRDHAAVLAAAAAGPVLPLFVLDDSRIVRAPGGASRWWLHHSLQALDRSLSRLGGRLLLLRGSSAELLPRLVAETGAGAVHALRQTEPWWPRIEPQVPGLVLHEGTTLVPPGLLRTRSGGRFRLFTPFWRTLLEWGDPPPRPAPERLEFAPAPAGERLEDWGLLPRAPDWSTGFADWQPGEEGARARLADMLPKLHAYAQRRDYPAETATSRLSPHLHFGEISPAELWHAAGDRAIAWRRQLAWRDFAHEMLDQYPKSASRPHRPEFEHIPWTDVTTAEGKALLTAWQKGLTGYPLVDAGLRELWHSGWMHNRVRMVAASFLTKHLMIDWREGERWFWDTLLDADLANNAMGWQWVMGSGVDSAPYYRIFAPVAQSGKFDAAAYVRRWVPELAALNDQAIHGPFERGWNFYPPPVVEHRFARARALAAWQALPR